MLQNSGSQQRYAVYMARLLCYCLRVLPDGENAAASVDAHPDAERSDDISSESGIEYNGEGSDDGNDIVEARPDATFQAVVNDLKDARRLYPWRGRQKELAVRLRQAVQDCWEIVEG